MKPRKDRQRTYEADLWRLDRPQEGLEYAERPAGVKPMDCIVWYG